MMQFIKIIVRPYTQPVVFSLGYRSMKMHFTIFPGQQSPVLRVDIVETVCSVFESRVRSRFPPTQSLKQLEDVLREEWYSITLETIQNLYESIPGRLQAALQANGGPTPY
jgi:hypothetical protein